MFLRLNLLFEKKNKTKKDKDKESEKKDKSKKVFKFGGVKEEVIPHMPEEKKEAEIIRKKSQSKTPDIKLVEEKSEDEGEFKIQIIRDYGVGFEDRIFKIDNCGLFMLLNTSSSFSSQFKL